MKKKQAYIKLSHQLNTALINLIDSFFGFIFIMDKKSNLIIEFNDYIKVMLSIFPMHIQISQVIDIFTPWLPNVLTLEFGI